MSKYEPDYVEKKRRKDRITGFLIVAAFSLFIFGAALALGTEPHMTLERTGERIFRVTGENYFAGARFYSKTIEGVADVRSVHGARNDRSESIEERNRRMRQKSLKFEGANGAALRWGRVSDQPVVDEFMRGTEPRLALVDTPPLWRKALTWFCVGLGALILWGGVQTLFSKKVSGLP